MNRKLKLLTLLTLGITSIGGIVAVSSTLNTTSMTVATACEHKGNHYTALVPTSTTGGTKEYWVCCECHEHYFVAPTGTWSDAGTAGSVESTDDRYWSLTDYKKSDEFKNSLKELGFGSVSYYKGKQENGFSIKDYDGKSSTLIIPDGVTYIGKDAFKSNKCNMEWIVIPSGCGIDMYAFSGQSNCTIYVTDKTSRTSSTYKVKALYSEKGTGWDYVDGVPTAK